jgi:hypothetical protein
MTQTNLIAVPQIYETKFQGLFYDTATKNYFICRHSRKVRSVKRRAEPNDGVPPRLRQIAWNTVRPRYVNKMGDEHVYTYRFVLIPNGVSYIRVREGELEKFWALQNELAQPGTQIHQDDGEARREHADEHAVEHEQQHDNHQPELDRTTATATVTEEPCRPRGLSPSPTHDANIIINIVVRPQRSDDTAEH